MFAGLNCAEYEKIRVVDTADNNYHYGSSLPFLQYGRCLGNTRVQHDVDDNHFQLCYEGFDFVILKIKRV